MMHNECPRCGTFVFIQDGETMAYCEDCLNTMEWEEKMAESLRERGCEKCSKTFKPIDENDNLCMSCSFANPMEPDYDALAAVEPTTTTELEGCAYPVAAVGSC